MAKKNRNNADQNANVATATEASTEQQAGATNKAKAVHLPDVTDTVADGMTEDLQARFDTLFNTRFYKEQTKADLAKVVLNAGLKAVEKRRKDTEKSQIDKATAILAARGIKVVAESSDEDEEAEEVA